MKTTREAAREASHKKLVNILTGLLEKNYDAEKGYKKAMEHTDHSNLRHFLRNQAVQRNHFATELDKHIHLLNEHPKDKIVGSSLGTLHRFWIGVKSSWSKKDDQGILDECIRGEKASLKEYEEKINKNILPPKIKEVLEDHRDKIKSTLMEIKLLEDLKEY